VGEAVRVVGEAVRVLNAAQRESAITAARQLAAMQALLAAPSVSGARTALDKAARRFDKDKYKKRGSLALRGLSLEVHQRALQKATVE
jgi:hypothetical protein